MTRIAERWIFVAALTLANLFWFIAYGKLDVKLHRANVNLKNASAEDGQGLCWYKDDQAELERYKQSVIQAQDAFRACKIELMKHVNHGVKQ